MAQRRSTDVALDYVKALSPGVKANCWALAEAAGHEGWERMQALLGSYRWDWEECATRRCCIRMEVGYRHCLIAAAAR
jgi:hypothetical protein